MEARRALEHVRTLKDEFVDFLATLASLESPTDRPEKQRPVQELLGRALEDLGFDVRVIPGKTTGGHIYARPTRHPRGAPAQLLIGHTDTVWPLRTLERMPVKVEQGRLLGPGTFDMKGGLTQIVFALKALRDLDLAPVGHARRVRELRTRRPGAPTPSPGSGAWPAELVAPSSSSLRWE